MNDRIYLSSPDVGRLEEDAVVAAMRSGWIAPLGPDVDAFELDLAARVGVAHGVALSSGTATLHLGLLALGVGRGDVVITSTMTFAATANAIVYTGAEPYFIDCLPDTGNMDPALLRRTMSELTSAGERVAAIVPVDLLGKAVDYTSILAIADEFSVPVLADAAESLGATHRGKAAGSFGRASVVSFNGNKIMTTSGGGMLLTDDAELAQHVRYLATQARQPVAHYEHTDIGYNYRMSNLLAALGRAQLGRLDEMIGRRREMRVLYKRLFAGIDGVEVFGALGDEADNVWLTSVLVDADITGWSTADLSAALAEDLIESRPLWKPMHLQPVFAAARGQITGEAQRLFESGLTLPSGSVLSARERERIISAAERFPARRAEVSGRIALLSTYDFFKRVFDVWASATGLLVLAPVIALVALMVRLDLGRPVLFAQDRPGLHARIFTLYKFRSMRNVGEARDLVTDADRLTPFGRLLRSTSLDELPSLWNVLKGDMSLVGPRPLLVEYLPIYSETQARRHDVRPGMTGLAQVNGRNALSWVDKFRYDIEYVDRLNPLLDAKILFATLRSVLSRQGINHEGHVTMAKFGTEDG